MKKSIDCLIIGHNQVDFDDYVKSIEKMGVNSGAYRDLNLSFVRYQGRPHHASGMFNLVSEAAHSGEKTVRPINDGDAFSATVSYLGTYLHRRGFTFDYVNSFKDGQDELAEKLQQDNILTIAVTTTLYISALPILEIMKFIRKYNPSATIIIGGPFISTQCRVADPPTLEYLFESIGADIYVNSPQGESALVNIIEHLKNNKPPDTVNNIYYKKNQKYVKNPILRENNLLADNMVNWDLFSDGAGEYVNLRTAISCPFSCSFCGFPEHAGKYQTADPGAVEGELNRLAPIESIKRIHFIDDTFNLPVKRFKEILRMMIKNKYRFKWHSQFRCQFADREMVELMKESGCEGVFLGIESGNDQILANMNKAATVGDYLRGIGLLKEYGILTYGSFIIGFPGETHDTVRDTIRFIEGSGLDFYRTQLWYCDAMTPIWNQREKYKINGSNFEWSHAEMNAREACDLIDDIFLSVRASTWLPQQGFDFTTIFNLANRGISPAQARNFIKGFNDGVQEKLLNTPQHELSTGVMNRLKDALVNDGATCDDVPNPKKPKQDIVIDFDLD